MLSSALSSLRRSALSLLALALPLIAVPALCASPITYQMTFTSGGYTGTGILTLASQPAGSGVTNDTVVNQQIQGLTFTVADRTYNFSTDPSASAQFVDGQLSKINFGQAFSQTSTAYTLELSKDFSLYGSNLTNPLITGSYTVVSDQPLSDQSATTSPTPEPRSLILVSTALLGGGLLVFLRRRAAHS